MLQLFYSSDSLWWMPKNKKKKIQNIHHEHTYFFKLLVHDILLHPKLNLKFFFFFIFIIFLAIHLYLYLFIIWRLSFSFRLVFMMSTWWYGVIGCIKIAKSHNRYVWKHESERRKMYRFHHIVIMCVWLHNWNCAMHIVVLRIWEREVHLKGRW